MKCGIIQLVAKFSALWSVLLEPAHHSLAGGPDGRRHDVRPSGYPGGAIEVEQADPRVLLPPAGDFPGVAANPGTGRAHGVGFNGDFQHIRTLPFLERKTHRHMRQISFQYLAKCLHLRREPLPWIALAITAHVSRPPCRPAFILATATDRWFRCHHSLFSKRSAAGRIAASSCCAL